MPIPLDLPFVLLDDARPGGSATLFTGLGRLHEARDLAGVEREMEALRGLRQAAGFLAYEAGLALEPKLHRLFVGLAEDAPPLLWMGEFAHAEPVDAAALLPDPAGAWAGAARPLIARDTYLAALHDVHEHILDGDIYQANVTFPADVPFAGHPLALYAALRGRARAGHGAIVFTGAHWLLSFSPELFFTLEGRRLTARPMKGTAVRRADPAADAAEAETLAGDPKQRSENLMIVDLLRNDLSRVAEPGTVEVPELFRVETYPTVHQLVSGVTAKLADGLDPVDALRALFPCGSITGAPKIRAMEVIAAQERAPRGVYCGAIGRIGRDGVALNVAIRTMVVRPGAQVARIGLGAGIVADSVPANEWRECLAKGAFVQTQRRFDLIETMRHDPMEGVVDLERHLSRMKASADALGFAFERHRARNELQAAGFGLGHAAVRLLLARSGAMTVETRPLPPAPDGPVPVALAPLPVDAADFRLAHKTSDRAFYREALAAAGTFEVAFVDLDGFLTEGSFTNLFVARGDRLITPPLARGLLPGVLRARLIEEGRAEQGDVRPADLSDGFLIGNALRGLIAARLV